MRFAFNHILAPKLPLETFLAKARSLGATEVEIRNDLPDVVGTTAPEEGARGRRKAGFPNHIDQCALSISTFWSGRSSGARNQRLQIMPQQCGEKAVVMCPLNTGASLFLRRMQSRRSKAFRPLASQ